jgi:hypothetical protein
MLFCYPFSEKNYALMEQINTYANTLVLGNNFPCFIHLPAPTDIIKNKNGVAVNFFEALLKVP